MQIDSDVRKTVVFFGYEDSTPGRGGIECVGTGFLLGYDGFCYIVTAKHLAHHLGTNPFLVRVNTSDGGSENLHADNVLWFDHPDPLVDVAVANFGFPVEKSKFDVLYLPQSMLATDALIYHETIRTIGTGDPTYTVGLFRLMSGTKRNLPIVHSGAIAMMPRDEKIPMTDWRPPHGRIFVEGYLVETHGLKGLSGSPVFVRPTVRVPRIPIRPDASHTQRSFALAGRIDVMLLGVWSTSWDALPDDVLAVESGSMRVPLGMGVVVPAEKIEETLMQEALVTMREEGRANQLDDSAASSSAVQIATDGTN